MTKYGRRLGAFAVRTARPTLVMNGRSAGDALLGAEADDARRGGEGVGGFASGGGRNGLVYDTTCRGTEGVTRSFLN